jgi:succinylglutamate desuccinylase
MKTINTNISDTVIYDSGVEGPTITIMGGLHGDEPSGTEIVKNLMEQGIELIRGRIKLVLGNPEAIELNQRFVKKDANRLFAKGEEFADTPDFARVQELKKFIAEFGGTDILLDIHNIRTKPQEGAPNSFATCANPEHPEAMNALTYLGISPVLVGQGLLGADLTPVYSDTFAASIGAVGITIEGGYMKEPETDKIASAVKNVLASYGMIGGHKIKNKKPKTINAHTSLMAKANFKFAATYSTWDVIPTNTTYATDVAEDGSEIVYNSGDKPVVLIFPKAPANIKSGEEACILAEVI